MVVSYTLRAVVVGIDEYTHARQQNISQLQCARNDAQEVANMLHISTALRLEADTPHLLTNKQASKRVVHRAINDCFSRHNPDPKTISLFYFAGHGVVKNEQVYLCCHDVDFYYPELEGGIRLNEVYDWLKTCSAECAIAIIDACFSGGLATENSAHVSAAEHARHAIQDMKAPDGKNIAIMAACRSDQQAREDPLQKHGFFTRQLLLGLRDGQARDPDGTVTLVGLINYLGKSFAHEHHQKPKFSFNVSDPIILSTVAPFQQLVREPPQPIRPSLPGAERIATLPLPDNRPVPPPSSPSVQPTLTPQPEPSAQVSNRSAHSSRLPDFEIFGPSHPTFNTPEREPILKSPLPNVNFLKRGLLILGLLLLFTVIYFLIWH
jgi:hypothetical protein